MLAPETHVKIADELFQAGRTGTLRHRLLDLEQQADRFLQPAFVHQHDVVDQRRDDAQPVLARVAEHRAERILDAHLRARAGAGRDAERSRRGLTVTPQEPVDILSVQLLMPTGGAQ